MLTELLLRGGVLTHPFVIGELALGSLRQRDLVLGALHDLPRATVADDGEIMDFISHRRLHGRGIGFIDVHLLAAVRLTPGSALWTRDKRLGAAAVELGLPSTGAIL